MKQAKFVAFEQNVIVCNFLLNFVMTFASGADHQASSAIASKQSFNVKKYTQSQFVHMLQTLPVSSNSEVLIITFTREIGIHPLVRDEDLSIQYFFCYN